jgi:5-methylthioadenosine/S-adenosylhomocysteine deaminase
MKKTFYLLMAITALHLEACKKTSYNADIIIKGGTVVTMDDDRNLIEDGMVVIRKGTIAAIGQRSELESKYTAPEIIDADGKAVIPGLINTHTHVPMTLFRGLADDLNLDEWLTEHIFPAEAKHVNEPFVRAGTRLALAEMIRGGTTTYCDMYYYENAIAEETVAAGLRGVLAQCVIDFPAPGFGTPEEAFSLMEQFVQKWKGHDLITPALGPHAPYTVSAQNLSTTRQMSERLNAPVVIHVSETAKEVSDMQQQKGTTPVQYLASLSFLSNNTIIAHAVHVNDAELDLIKQHGCGVAHNPESNMKLASGIAPVPKMLARNIPVGLGTDGAASNNDLNMWEEMNMVAKLHKVAGNNPELIPAKEAFAMATIKGAAALHLEKITGSIEAGKRADIAIVDLDGLHQTPRYDIYSCLVYTTKASDVRSVIVNGRLLMKDRLLLTLDEQAIKNTALEYQKIIRGE